MNEFITDLVRNRELEYYNEIGTSSLEEQYGAAQKVVGRVLHCPVKHFKGTIDGKIVTTSIRVTILQDNPKSGSTQNGSRKFGSGLSRYPKSQRRHHHERMHDKIVLGQQGPPPAPPRFMASPSSIATEIYAPTPPLSSSSRRKRAVPSSPAKPQIAQPAIVGNTTPRPAYDERRRRWSGSQESPTSMPKCPQRATPLSPSAGSPTTNDIRYGRVAISPRRLTRSSPHDPSPSLLKSLDPWSAQLELLSAALLVSSSSSRE